MPDCASRSGHVPNRSRSPMTASSGRAISNRSRSISRLRVQRRLRRRDRSARLRASGAVHAAGGRERQRHDRLHASSTVAVSVRRARSPSTSTRTRRSGAVARHRAWRESARSRCSSIASDAEPLVDRRAARAHRRWVTTESGRLVISPPIGTPIGEVRLDDRSCAIPGGLTASVPMSVTVTNLAPTAVADSVDAIARDTGRGLGLDNDVDPDGPNAAPDDAERPGDGHLPQRRGRDDLDRRGAASSASIPAQGGARRRSPTPCTTATGRVRAGHGDRGRAAAQHAPFANDQTIDVRSATCPTDIVLDVSDRRRRPAHAGRPRRRSAGVVTAQAGLTPDHHRTAAGTYQVTYRVSDGIDSPGGHDHDQRDRPTAPPDRRRVD